MKPRILLCNEFSELKTGYAIYGKEVLTRLFNTGKFDLFEHAAYAHHGDPRAQGVKWAIYCNLPEQNDEQQQNIYNSNPSNQFGAWRFEEICLDCIPHFVCDIRDRWMMSFQFDSPFRSYYNHVIMPTVDAYPQNDEWISNYETADGVFTYQDWSKDVLDNESAKRINTLGAASPAADDVFQPMDGKEIKKSIGFNDCKIVGTIMRNQRRKLFPDLFYSFRKFLDYTKRDDILLYCHTSYPDLGWDIPRLLLKYGISSKTLFTYLCRKCGHAQPHLFSDALIHCPRCGQFAAGISNVQAGVDNKVLAAIINMFDIYIQWSNSEGFGMPVVEAAACGVPIIAMDYSAMSDTSRKLKGIPIKPLTLNMELETGCNRAVANNDLLIQQLVKFSYLSDENMQEWKKETRQAYLDNYSWDATAKKWENYFDSVDVNYYEQKWKSKPNYINPPTDYPKGMSNLSFARWLITNVLGEPRYVNSYMEGRLTRDLNYQVSNISPGGMYFNENAILFSKPNWKTFTQEDAFKHFVELGNRRNFWEQKRWEKINK